MWCREGVQAESSGMPLARSPSGWDQLHRHDFKREKIAVPCGETSAPPRPFSVGWGKNTWSYRVSYRAIFTQLWLHSYTSSRKETHSRSRITLFFWHRLRLQQQISLSWVPRAKTGTCSSRQQVVFISSPLKWAEQTGSGAFKHSLLAGTQQTTNKKQVPVIDIWVVRHLRGFLVWIMEEHQNS